MILNIQEYGSLKKKLGIKNYALQKLVYALSSLPNPPQRTVKKIEKLMYNLLWDGNGKKIKEINTLMTTKLGD